MGRHAQHAWIIRVFAIALAMLWPALAFASASAIAPGVALNTSAGCGNGNLDISLTTVGANRESWHGTNAAGATLAQIFDQSTALSNYSAPPPAVFLLPFSSIQPANTLIGSYAYVGETPPSATNTAEFFVFYNCTTRAILLSCYGPYGTCPQTAQQAMAKIAAWPGVPALGPLTLALMVVLVAGVGGLALARRT
jgi:hypothetical protein